MHSPLRHLGSILWKRRPIQLTFFVTRKCNARCPFCFYLAGAGPPAAHDPELSLPEIERIAGGLGSLLWLAFSGGEPFLRRDLPEISRIFYRRNRPAIMLYPTNGLTPELIAEQTERILRDCPRSVIAVKLSLDGVGEAHDRLRGTPGGFAKVIETYERLAPLLDRYPQFELGVNTVFCRANQDHMDGIADFVARLKRIRTHTVSLVRGELADAGYKQVDLGKYQRIAQRLGDELRRGVAPVYAFRGARLKAAQDIVQRRMILRTAREPQRLIRLLCRAIEPRAERDRRGVPVRDAHAEPRQRARPRLRPARHHARGAEPAQPWTRSHAASARAHTSATSSPTFSLTRGSTRR